jgi:undecaprenyl-diphosphatase
VLVLLLLGFAAVGGLIAGAIVMRWPSVDPASPRVARRSAEAVADEIVAERGFRHFLASRTNPAVATGLMLTVAMGFVVVGGLALGALAYLTRSRSELVTLDSDISQWVNDHSSQLVHDVLQMITQLGSTEFVILAAIVLAVVEIRRRPSRWIIPFLLAVMIGEGILTNVVKELLARARPTLNPTAHLLGPSFPSGHTATAAAFWAAAALLLGRGRSQRAHALLAGGAVAIAIAVACSRVFLDVHWFSDVLGGLALGWAWFAVCSIAFGGRLLRLGAPVEIAERAVSAEPTDPALADPAPADPALAEPPPSGPSRSGPSSTDASRV